MTHGAFRHEFNGSLLHLLPRFIVDPIVFYIYKGLQIKTEDTFTKKNQWLNIVNIETFIYHIYVHLYISYLCGVV